MSHENVASSAGRHIRLGHDAFHQTARRENVSDNLF